MTINIETIAKDHKLNPVRFKLFALSNPHYYGIHDILGTTVTSTWYVNDLVKDFNDQDTNRLLEHQDFINDTVHGWSYKFDKNINEYNWSNPNKPIQIITDLTQNPISFTVIENEQCTIRKMIDLYQQTSDPIYKRRITYISVLKSIIESL